MSHPNSKSWKVVETVSSHLELPINNFQAETFSFVFQCKRIKTITKYKLAMTVVLLN